MACTATITTHAGATTITPQAADPGLSINTVDLSGCSDSDLRRSAVVGQISRAARDPGLFQVINHGIPSETIDRTISAVRAFHEQPAEVKARFHRRDKSTAVSYLSEVDVYNAKAASGRDTLQMRMRPDPPAPEELPEICREEVLAWDHEVVRLLETLMGLMSEGLGLSTERLEEVATLEAMTMAGNYYPPCPPGHDPTPGLTSHTDPLFLTVLIQDQIGGLQVNYGGVWVDVTPVPGAIVVNVGDSLQIISNDEYKSVEHRVLANTSGKSRVSIPVFIKLSKTEELCGPLPELVSVEKPARFRQFTSSEFVKFFFTKEFDGKSLVNYYRV